MSKPVILTGIRANNSLHIGNYFGALLPMVDMAQNKADEYQINLFIPDLHSLTADLDYANFQSVILNNLKMYVSAGLPLNKADVYIYRQSFIPAHSELTILLNSFIGMGELSRMTQYKEKSAKFHEDRIPVSLFSYPVLMAADILAYGASYIPVGDDQTQHLEFTRDVAIRINNLFGDIFVVPRPVKQQHALFMKDQGLRIKDLVDPSKKMSKSSESDKGTIFLNDKPEDAYTKIMASTTDSLGVINYDKASQPGISNLLEILSLVSKKPLDQIISSYQGQTSYGEFKKIVAAQVRDFLIKFQSSYDKIDEAEIYDKLKHSEIVMNQQANKTVYRLQKALGLRS